jgi:subtilase family serine protease
VLGALATPFFGAAPSVAASGTTKSANFEAVCGPATPGTAQCLALRRTDIGAPSGSAVSPQATTGFLTPADIKSAYALPTGSQGSGLTVAIVDAYDLPTAEADLTAYRSNFGLPACTTANNCFRKVNQSGGTGPYPAANAGWGNEIALDIEMVSAACPNCNILLVEANSSNFYDLGPAVNTAVSLGAIAVSNSYGGPEWSSESYYDTQYYNHPGVAITAATGDCGYNCTGVFKGTTSPSVEYPAASPYVIAVGGTRLTGSQSAGWTESAWGDSYGGAGSGCSLYEPKPSWQHDTGCTNRTQADVSAVADPATGVWIYVNGGWVGGYGGTSVASPIIAATFALAGRPAAGTYPASYLYAHPAALNDVVGGNNDVTYGSCPTGSYLCNGVAGYDGPTGLGTPNGIGAFASPVISGATYHALTPTRILDTRSGTGLSGVFSSHSARTFQVAGVGGVPAGATAVTGNLTVTAQTSGGYLYIGPNATDYPTSSTLNFPVKDDRANGVTVALGGGTLSVTYVGSTSPATAHVIFDVTGYFTPDMTGSTYHALTPARILDTRNGTGGLSGPFSSHVARTFGVAGAGGVPANATAVTGNLTVTSQTSGGYLYIGPNATNNPTSSTLNFPLADDRANGVTVALGAGTLSVTYVPATSPSTAHVIFDVTGYFTPDMTGATYHALTPARILDTRNGTGLSGVFGSHSARTFGVAGAGGVPANATAVTGNLTVTSQTSGGYLYIGPNATNNPTSSTLNFPLADDRANGVTVALGAGTLSVTYVGSTSPATAHVIFDVTGYFTP